MSAGPDETPEPCSGCGAPVPGGSTGCQAIFEALLARDFADARYFRVHRMLVDTYSLQHPDRYCASAKSLAAHLAGLGLILERGASPAVGSAALRRWLDGSPVLEKPPLPEDRGALTIADVREAEDPLAHATAVERWARTTWEAYAPLHAVAREWMRTATSPPRRPPKRKDGTRR